MRELARMLLEKRGEEIESFLSPACRLPKGDEGHGWHRAPGLTAVAKANGQWRQLDANEARSVLSLAGLPSAHNR